MRYTKTALASLATSALLISPLIASADTISDLQAKIQSLLSQLSSVQTQLQQLQESSVTQTQLQQLQESSVTPTQSATDLAKSNVSSRCPVILRTLTVGARGADVSDLQSYLSQQGVFQGEATGYFGSQTQAAVQAWQKLQGLASSGDPSSTGWGVFGPRSQSTIVRLCPGLTKGSFSADPPRGSAPLTVVFSVSVPAVNSTHTYTVDFGDGTRAVTAQSTACLASVGGSCADTRVVKHTYTADGAYTAALYRAAPSESCTGAEACGTSIASTQINVRTPLISCSIVDCAPGYHLEGAQCSGEQKCVADVTTSTRAPSITSVDGPVTLRAGQQGTWTVHASIPSGVDSNLRYAVTWGDESILDRLQALANGSSAVSASGSFTHAYANAGAYTPLFTVSNSGGSSEARMSVQVGGTLPIICPVYSAQACPAGYTTSGGTTDSNGCYRPGPCVPVSGCIDAGTTYPEGTQRTCLSNGDGTTRCIADASFVCRSGTWETGGSTMVDPTTGSLTATPSSGAAPLAVSFTGDTDSGCSGGNFSLSYGDGSSESILIPADGCRDIFSRSHTYAAAGTYTASLTESYGGCNAPAGAACGASALGKVIGTAKVTVTAGNTVLSAKPSSGFAPLSVEFAVHSSANIIDFGDGSSDTIKALTCPQVSGSSSYRGSGCFGTITHTYTRAGTFTATLKQVIGSRENYSGGDTNIYETAGTATVTVIGLYSAADNGNLANALTALQGALSKLLSVFGN